MSASSELHACALRRSASNMLDEEDCFEYLVKAEVGHRRWAKSIRGNWKWFLEPKWVPKAQTEESDDEDDGGPEGCIDDLGIADEHIARFFSNIDERCLRDDGLYTHSFALWPTQAYIDDCILFTVYDFHRERLKEWDGLAAILAELKGRADFKLLGDWKPQFVAKEYPLGRWARWGIPMPALYGPAAHERLTEAEVQRRMDKLLRGERVEEYENIRERTAFKAEHVGN